MAVQLVWISLLLLPNLTNRSEVAAQGSNLLARIEMSARVYFPDARSVSTSHKFEKVDKLTTGVNEIYTTSTLCIFSTNYKKNPSEAGYGWRFEVTLLEETGSTAVVRVDWNRSRDRGQSTTTPNGSVVLTLAPGKAVPLDYIVPGPPAGSCNAVGMLLEISMKV